MSHISTGFVDNGVSSRGVDSFHCFQSPVELSNQVAAVLIKTEKVLVRGKPLGIGKLKTGCGLSPLSSLSLLCLKRHNMSLRMWPLAASHPSPATSPRVTAARSRRRQRRQGCGQRGQSVGCSCRCLGKSLDVC
jgi:hypothetical protein